MAAIGSAFGVARIVFGVYVLEAPRALAVKLDHRFTLGEHKVLDTRGPISVGSRGHRLRLRCVKTLTHAHIKRSRNNSDSFHLRMNVRRNAIAIWKQRAKYKR